MADEAESLEHSLEEVEDTRGPGRRKGEAGFRVRVRGRLGSGSGSGTWSEFRLRLGLGLDAYFEILTTPDTSLGAGDSSWITRVRVRVRVRSKVRVALQLGQDWVALQVALGCSTGGQHWAPVRRSEYMQPPPRLACG